MTTAISSADALAERAGIAPRGSREWLEQQAVAGLLAGTGQVLPRTVAAHAGFSSVDVLPVQNDFFRLYRLHP